MKLRIKGNTLRLRLSQNELNIFSKTGVVSNSVSFGPGINRTLTYTIISFDGNNIDVNFDQNKIEVCIPHQEANIWASSDIVSLNNSLLVNDGQELFILIEKDFQCLHKRPGEDEEANFPNPLAKKNELI